MFRISHVNLAGTVVADAGEVGRVVTGMVEQGMTNILVTREGVPVNVKRLGRLNPIVPKGAAGVLRFDVVVQRG